MISEITSPQEKHAGTFLSYLCPSMPPTPRPSLPKPLPPRCAEAQAARGREIDDGGGIGASALTWPKSTGQFAAPPSVLLCHQHARRWLRLRPTGSFHRTSRILERCPIGNGRKTKLLQGDAILRNIRIDRLLASPLQPIATYGCLST